MRLIDADALSKDLEKRWNVNDDQDFCNKEVWHALEEAPTIEPNGDLISRQAAIDAFRNVLDSDFPYISEVTPRERIESIPSAPDSRQRGEWIDNHNGTFTCDQCGWKHSKSNFCPNCGADMRGEEE